MQLTHSFTVPASVEETWQAFNDIEGVAGCFPGATVTSVEGDSFQGSCKVKLGPIALVYNGSGQFVEKDEATRTMKIAAKGKDKRGNGTAGADVVATMVDADGGTEVTVVTDLAITGKPAQFGRGVIQDVSDKLLGQFVDCLEGRLQGGSEDEPAAGAAGSSAGGAGADARAGDDVQDSLPGSGDGARSDGRPAADPGAAAAVASPPRPRAGASSSSTKDDGALDLGATVVPILLKTYGKHVALGLAGLLALVWIVRRLR